MVSNMPAEVQALIQSMEVIASRAGKMASRVAGRGARHVEGSTPRTAASLTKESVTGITPVSHVVKLAMANTSVPLRSQRNEAVHWASQYLWYDVWDPESDFTPTTAKWTETAKPLPRPP